MSAPHPPVAWDRRRLLTVLFATFMVLMVLIAGLVFAVSQALTSRGTGDRASDMSTTGRQTNMAWPTNPEGIRGSKYRNAVAAQPMLTSTADDMHPSPPALRRPGRMVIGTPTATGPAGIPTGFAHTPQGAVGELAAIEIATFSQMSLDYAHDVFDRWASSHASFTRWEIAQSIQAFHTAAGTVDGDGSVNVTANPVGAQIKGIDGPDWVVACVQLDVTAVVAQQARFGYGHCERMQWHDDRWMIGAGAPPAPAPSTWPGSQRSRAAGWLEWVNQKADS